jgi:cyclopropane fatty-acyl-phospholipid synthase-like methyltransferase
MAKDTSKSNPADQPDEILLASNEGAFYDESQVLRQHQVVLMYLQSVLARPDVTQYDWLDVGCGQGQIFVNMEEALGSDLRGKLASFLVDKEASYLRHAKAKANTLGLRRITTATTDLVALSQVFPERPDFDLITLLNTCHEVSPRPLAQLLVDVLLRLSPNGHFIAYDMEMQPERELELGAVNWTKREIADIFDAMFSAIGEPTYRPSIAQWPHASCTCWSLQFDRAHVTPTNQDIAQRREEAIRLTVNRISQLLQEKLLTCQELLTTFKEQRPENREDKVSQIRALYDYWALTQAIATIQ